MRRREFIAGLGSAAAWQSTRAQPIAVPAVGFLHNGALEAVSERLAFFSAGLVQGGYEPGRNVTVEYRFADNYNDRLPALVAELVRLPAAVIAATNTPTVLAAQPASRAIPVVFNIGADPVQLGLVASLSRPGGNITGVSTLNLTMVSKRMELLHQVIPAKKSIAMLSNPTNPEFNAAETLEAQRAATVLGRRLITVDVSSPRDLEPAFASVADQHAGAVVVNAEPLFLTTWRQIVALGSRYAIPVMSVRREQALSGGLMSYGTDYDKVYAMVGAYCARILSGEKAADLPAQQITKVELIVNLKVAKAFGVTVPETLLATADEVIE
jgi:putative ABC transport system substrate-binding protein